MSIGQEEEKPPAPSLSESDALPDIPATFPPSALEIVESATRDSIHETYAEPLPSAASHPPRVIRNLFQFMSSGETVQLSREGLEAIRLFIVDVIQLIQTKYGLPFSTSKLAKAPIISIEKKLTKYGIKDMQNIRITFLGPGENIGPEFIESSLFKIECVCAPKRPLNDPHANGNISFQLLLKVRLKHGKVSSVTCRNSHMLSLCTEVLTDIGKKSDDARKSSQAFALARLSHAALRPFQGGRPGSGKRK